MTRMKDATDSYIIESEEFGPVEVDFKPLGRDTPAEMVVALESEYWHTTAYKIEQNISLTNEEFAKQLVEGIEKLQASSKAQAAEEVYMSQMDQGEYFGLGSLGTDLHTYEVFLSERYRLITEENRTELAHLFHEDVDFYCQMQNEL